MIRRGAWSNVTARPASSVTVTGKALIAAAPVGVLAGAVGDGGIVADGAVVGVASWAVGMGGWAVVGEGSAAVGDGVTGGAHARTTERISRREGRKPLERSIGTRTSPCVPSGNAAADRWVDRVRTGRRARHVRQDSPGSAGLT